MDSKIVNVCGKTESDGRKRVDSVILEDGSEVQAEKVTQDMWNACGLNMEADGTLSVLQPTTH